MKIGVPQSWRRIKERYNLLGSYCEKCGSYYFPKREICPKCKNEKLTEKELSKEGEIFSYTILYSPASGFSEKIPYIIALVKLENGPMIIGNIVDAKENEVEIGKKVEVVFRKWIDEDDGGLIHYGYAFKLK